MTDHKFTDEEAVKGLSIYVHNKCENCNVKDLGICCNSCFIACVAQVGDLANRQKAEIKELVETNKTLADTLIGRLNITVNIPEVEFKYMFPHHTCKRFKKGEAKAVKEFADNVLQELWQMNWHYGQLPCSEEDKTTQRAIKKCIEVVKRKTKEMTEENNE